METWWLHWFLKGIFFDVTIPVCDIYTLRKKKHIPFKPVNLKFSDNLVRVAPNKALQVMGCYFQFFILTQQILQKINETTLGESLRKLSKKFCTGVNFYFNES